MRRIDHVVYCVPNLDEAVQSIHNLTGIKPIIGGKHQTKGTKNALLNLGNQCYLEILAVDKDNKKIKENRWMGIDHIEGHAQMTRWSMKGNIIEKDSQILKEFNPKMGVIDEGSRKTSNKSLLKWQMILPLSSPKVEIMPFVTDWTESKSHPTDNLKEGCTLIKLQFEHPEPNKIQIVFDKLKIDTNVLKGDAIKLTAFIQSPKGLIVL